MEDSDLTRNNERMSAYEMRRAFGEIAEQVKITSRLINAFQERFAMNDPKPNHNTLSRFSKTWRELKDEKGRSLVPTIVCVALCTVVLFLIWGAL